MSGISGSQLEAPTVADREKRQDHLCLMVVYGQFPFLRFVVY
jgi:hypothetical protein